MYINRVAYLQEYRELSSLTSLIFATRRKINASSLIPVIQKK